MRLRSQSLHERCMAHPALIPAVAFAIGIAIARYMPMPIWGIIIPAVATVVFAALGRTLPSLAIGLAMTGYICGDSALPDLGVNLALCVALSACGCLGRH